ncbi:hypothetical protein C0992_003403 [Termitomyces sp. T32_za158]|nr:hypothetical protein C0992_003403 [Termitomyces sp. T32_za158]
MVPPPQFQEPQPPDPVPLHPMAHVPYIVPDHNPLDIAHPHIAPDHNPPAFAHPGLQGGPLPERIIHHHYYNAPPPAEPIAHRTPDSSSDIAKLPPLATIPRLSGSNDWGGWHPPVMALLDHLWLIGHVCPLPPPHAPYDATCKDVVPPPYPPHASIVDERNYEMFWRNDNICSYVLTGKLLTDILGCLPPAHGGPHNFPIHTARNILGWLCDHYSAGSAAMAQKIKDTVFHLNCSPTSIPTYVQE